MSATPCSNGETRIYGIPSSGTPYHLGYRMSAGDVDGDGIPNFIDLDSDGDGVGDLIEVSVGADPYNALDTPSLPISLPTLAALASLVCLVGYGSIRYSAARRNSQLGIAPHQAGLDAENGEGPRDRAGLRS